MRKKNVYLSTETVKNSFPYIKFWKRIFLNDKKMEPKFENNKEIGVINSRLKPSYVKVKDYRQCECYCFEKWPTAGPTSQGHQRSTYHNSGHVKVISKVRQQCRLRVIHQGSWKDYEVEDHKDFETMMMKNKASRSSPLRPIFKTLKHEVFEDLKTQDSKTPQLTRCCSLDKNKTTRTSLSSHSRTILDTQKYEAFENLKTPDSKTLQRPTRWSSIHKNKTTRNGPSRPIFEDFENLKTSSKPIFEDSEKLKTQDSKAPQATRSSSSQPKTS